MKETFCKEDLMQNGVEYHMLRFKFHDERAYINEDMYKLFSGIAYTLDDAGIIQSYALFEDGL